VVDWPVLRQVAIVLPVLLEKGIMSTVGEIRGLAIETLMKVVKNAGKEQLRPHMAALVTCMLESLSVRRRAHAPAPLSVCARALVPEAMLVSSAQGVARARVGWWRRGGGGNSE
jgi:hypothetical protein